MKFTKLLALALSVLMVVCLLAACDKDGEGGDTTTTEAGGSEAPDVTITVSIKVTDIDGNVVYDVPSYTYSGSAPTPIELIDDYFYMEKENETVELDEFDDIVAIGSVEAGDVTSVNADTNETVTLYTTYWWYKLNGRDSSVAMDEYTVQNGDSIEYYLKKVEQKSN